MSQTPRTVAGPQWLGEAAVVAVAAIVFTIVLTFPLAPQMGSHLFELGDSKFSTYVHTWVAHILTTHPTQLWNMNFFYPAQGTLACSENWLGDQWLFTPMYLATGNPIAAHNFVILSSFFLNAVTMYLLIRWLTRSPWAAAVGGFIYGFAFPRLSAIDHMHLLNLMWVPLIVLFLFRYLLYRNVRDLAALTGFMVLQILCSLYLGYLAVLITLCFFAGIAVVRRDLITWSAIRGLLVGAIVCGVLLAPLFLPYIQLQKQGTINTDLNEIQKASAEPLATYLDVWGWPNQFYAKTLKRFHSMDYGWEKRFFFGFLPMGLALVGVVSLITLRGRHLKTAEAESGAPLPEALQKAAIYGSIFTVISAYLLSLGPYLRIHSSPTSIHLPFFYLSRIVPGLSAFRVPARFAFAVLFGVAALAALGFYYLLERFSMQRSLLAKAALTAAVLGYMFLEFNIAPFKLPAVMAPPDIAPEYRWLAQQTAPSPIVELPITGPAEAPNPYVEATYVYGSVYHWQPIVNGYTSHPPYSAIEMFRLGQQLPAIEAASALRTLGVRYAIVHIDQLTPEPLAQWSGPHPGLTEIKRFGGTAVYKVDAPLCDADRRNLNMRSSTPEISAPGQPFGFEIVSDQLQHCWATTEGASGPQPITVQWTNESTSEVKRVKGEVRFPLHVEEGDRLVAEAIVRAPSFPGKYSFQVVEVDRHPSNLSPQTVALQPVPQQTSLNSPAGLAAQYRVRSLPSVFQASAGTPIDVSVRNTGSALWLPNLPPAKGTVALSYRWLDSSGKETMAGRLYLPYAIYPNQNYEFVGKIDAPDSPGEYTLSVEMVSELVSFFHDLGTPAIEAHVQVEPQTSLQR